MLQDFQLWLTAHHGLEPGTVFWSQPMRDIVPGRKFTDIGFLTSEENARAVNRLFGLMLDWLADR
jgi:hypothetical protein